MECTRCNVHCTAQHFAYCKLHCTAMHYVYGPPLFSFENIFIQLDGAAPVLTQPLGKMQHSSIHFTSPQHQHKSCWLSMIFGVFTHAWIFGLTSVHKKMHKIWPKQVWRQNSLNWYIALLVMLVTFIKSEIMQLFNCFVFGRSYKLKKWLMALRVLGRNESTEKGLLFKVLFDTLNIRQQTQKM